MASKQSNFPISNFYFDNLFSAFMEFLTSLSQKGQSLIFFNSGRRQKIDDIINQKTLFGPLEKHSISDSIKTKKNSSRRCNTLITYQPLHVNGKNYRICSFQIQSVLLFINYTYYFIQTMKQKKTQLSLNYDQAQKEHLRQHKQNLERAGYRIILQKQLNKNDKNQQFYKIYERQFRNALMMKHGYKIASLQVEQEDLALYCFSLLQAEANFPIKVFTLNHPGKKTASEEQLGSRKDIWMETHIMVQSLTGTSQDEHKFQTRIYEFFNDYLLKNLRDFMKRKINWDHMTSMDYTDEIVIKEFQQQVIQPANEKFSQLFE